MLKRAGTLIIFVASISFIIFVHELGHFLGCKLFNVATPVFSIGFGPALLQKKIGQTTFQIAALPLGGYVSMDVEALMQKPYWQKMIIIIAGISNNILLGVILLWFVLGHNRKKIMPVIESVEPDSPAYHAGLRPKDRIVKINDHDINNTQTLFKHIQQASDQLVTLEIVRNGQHILVPVKLTTTPMLGLPIASLGTTFEHTYNNASYGHAFIESCIVVYTILKDNLFALISTTRNEGLRLLKKPIATITATNQSMLRSLDMYLIAMATITIQIAFFNILPLPMLDGGQIVSYTVQTVVNRPLTAREMNIVYLIILCAFFVLMVSGKNKKHPKSTV